MGGACAEAARIGTGCIGKARYLGSGLGKVAAAALVHVAASLLAAVYDILDILFIDAGVLYGAYQRDNA